jgi:hypothetical protein
MEYCEKPISFSRTPVKALSSDDERAESVHTITEFAGRLTQMG